MRLTNADRAGYGSLAVTNGTPDFDRSGDEQTDLLDTLANLMHYAHAVGLDFDAALSSARMHYIAERAEEVGR